MQAAQILQRYCGFRYAFQPPLKNRLPKQLTGKFGQGFSVAHLENFRKFYSTFPSGEKSYALRRELTWTHHRLMNFSNFDTAAWICAPSNPKPRWAWLRYLVCDGCIDDVAVLLTSSRL